MPHSAFLAAVGTVLAAPGAVESVARYVAGSPGLPLVVELVNLTEETFLVEGVHHDLGDFQVAPPDVVASNRSVVFAAYGLSPDRCPSGRLTLTGVGLSVRLKWTDGIEAAVMGDRAERFATYVEALPGDGCARMRVVIYERGVEPVPAPGQREPEVVTVAFGHHRLDLRVGHGRRTSVRRRWWDGRRWCAEQVTEGEGSLDVVLRLAEEEWRVEWDGHAWNVGKNLGCVQYEFTGPAAVRWADGRLDVYGRGPAERLLPWTGGHPAGPDANRLSLGFRHEDAPAATVAWMGRRRGSAAPIPWEAVVVVADRDGEAVPAFGGGPVRLRSAA